MERWMQNLGALRLRSKTARGDRAGKGPCLCLMGRKESTFEDGY